MSYWRSRSVHFEIAVSMGKSDQKSSKKWLGLTALTVCSFKRVIASSINFTYVTWSCLHGYVRANRSVLMECGKNQ